MGSHVLYLVIASLSMAAVHSQNNPVIEFFHILNRAIQKEIQDIKNPLESTVVLLASSQCATLKKLVGEAYEQRDEERAPNLNQLTLNFINANFSIAYNLTTAAQYIPHAPGFKTNKKLFIFIHGFTDDPSQSSFATIREALFKQGEYNVLALDGSSLIHMLYLRSSTYVRMMGEKLGEVIAAMVNSGSDPASIHIIGHSLGAHVSGFAGKMFTNLTGLKIGRISGLDPAGPCFTHVEDGVRLNATDADFVDVTHTNGRVLGLVDPIGHVDYFPNEGMQQPNCLFQSCSHSRAWVYFAESVTNSTAFPAVKCKDYDAFEKGACDKEVSYMGLATKPSVSGQYYLQTGEDAPFGLGLQGTKYKNNDGIVKRVIDFLFD